MATSSSVFSDQRAQAALALANAALGWPDLAFAQQVGLPPHVNFLQLVVWMVVLGGSTLRMSVVDRPVHARLLVPQT